MRREAGITWHWAEAGRGAVTALPAAVIMLTVDVSLGIVFALGTLPVAMPGVPPRRGQRPRLGLAGLAFAVGYAAGPVLPAGRDGRGGADGTDLRRGGI